MLRVSGFTGNDDLDPSVARATVSGVIWAVRTISSVACDVQTRFRNLIAAAQYYKNPQAARHREVPVAFEVPVVDRHRIRVADQAHFVGNVAQNIGDAGQYGEGLRADPVLTGWKQDRLRKADDQSARLQAHIETVLLQTLLSAEQRLAGFGNDGVRPRIDRLGWRGGWRRRCLLHGSICGRLSLGCH